VLTFAINGTSFWLTNGDKKERADEASQRTEPAALRSRNYDECFGNLDGEGTHTVGRAVDQDLLARLNLGPVRPCGATESRHWDSSRLLKDQILGLAGHRR